MRLIPILAALVFGLAALPAAARPVNIEDVRAMALAHGIVKIEEIKLKRRGIWKVEGEDARGHEIEMKVDAATGAIVELERD